MIPDKEALWWSSLEGDWLECHLCPRNCRIEEGASGYCRVRQNRSGSLFALAYGRPVAVHADPIEKKPLYHFYPGSYTYSLGTFGCNLGCMFCQNWSLSHVAPNWGNTLKVPPQDVVQAALRSGCSSLAFTYNEPTVWGEYVLDISRPARKAGLKTVMVTNGYTSPEAREEIYAEVDAANVDLKAFSEDFYRRQADARLQPVLDTLVWLRNKTGVWLEVTCLVIPGLNDDPEMIRLLSGWVHDHLGPDTPLHFSAFHPNYRLLDRPPTAPAILRKAVDTARNSGLRFVYEGNVEGEGAHTCCPRCQKLLVRRSWHCVTENSLRGNRCPCGESIPGRYS